MTQINFISSSSIPSTLRGDRFQLRPLRTTDVELDYEAVMSSREMLRLWSQSDWPEDDFKLEGNLADLDRHQREHDAGEAFTYTVMNPENDRCLGCVYLNPLAPELIESGLCDRPGPAGGQTAAGVRFWVRAALLGSDLERELLSGLRDWFIQEWPVDCLFFLTSQLERRQQAFWEANGLRKRLNFESDGRTWVAYQGGESAHAQ
jgi:RimJ/RimL family protein N-acetyltransferase